MADELPTDKVPEISPAGAPNLSSDARVPAQPIPDPQLSSDKPMQVVVGGHKSHAKLWVLLIIIIVAVAAFIYFTQIKK